MTLQVVCRAVDAGGSVMELHGWLTGPEIEEFKAVCASRPLPLRIDLEQLAGASADGVLALECPDVRQRRQRREADVRSDAEGPHDGAESQRG